MTSLPGTCECFPHPQTVTGPCRRKARAPRLANLPRARILLTKIKRVKSPFDASILGIPIFSLTQHVLTEGKAGIPGVLLMGGRHRRSSGHTPPGWRSARSNFTFGVMVDSDSFPSFWKNGGNADLDPHLRVSEGSDSQASPDGGVV